MTKRKEHFQQKLPGFALKKDQTYFLQTGDILEILLGKYFYEIVFEMNSDGNHQTDKLSVAPPVTAAKNENGVWESVDDGKMLIFTPNNVKASNKVNDPTRCGDTE